mgnify:CR=1 FL=1
MTALIVQAVWVSLGLMTDGKLQVSVASLHPVKAWKDCTALHFYLVSNSSKRGPTSWVLRRDCK